MMKRLFVYATVLTFVLFLSACGEVVDGIRAVKQISDSVDIDTKNNQITIKQAGEDGGTLLLGGQNLPDGFPEKIPLPKDAQIVTSFKSSNANDGDSFALSVSTSVSMDEAKKQYSALFKELNFKDFSEFAMNDILTYSGSNDREVLSVTIMPEDDTSSTLLINFSYNLKPINNN